MLLFGHGYPTPDKKATPDVEMYLSQASLPVSFSTSLADCVWAAWAATYSPACWLRDLVLANK
jgi:hypothetical protein